MKNLLIIFLLSVSTFSYGEIFNLVCSVQSGNGTTESRLYIDSVKKTVKREEKLFTVKDLKVDDGSINIESIEDLSELGLGKRLNIENISRSTGHYKRYILSEKYGQSSLNGTCEPKKQNKF